MSDTYIRLDGGHADWKPWATVNDVEETEPYEITFERTKRPSVRLIQANFHDSPRRSSATVRFDGALNQKQISNSEVSSGKEKPGDIARERLRLPRWVRPAFVSCVTAELVAVGLVIATPIINDRIITVIACGVSALGLGVLAWMSSKVSSLRLS